MTPASFAQVVQHLLESTVCGLGVWAFVLALSRQSAAIRYRLWIAASLKFAVPLAPVVALGHHYSWRTAPLFNVMWLTDMSAQWRSLVAGPAAPAIVAPASAHPFMVVPLLLAWGAGSIAIVAGWWHGVRRFASVLRTATPIDGSAFGVPDGLRVVTAPSLCEPCIVGVWRPTLVLPAGILSQLTAEQLESVVAHELSHLRHRDNAIAALHMLIEAAFWFHPAVWFIERRLVEERERACDEAVLERGVQPETYAEAILKICRHYVTGPSPIATGIAGADLRQRIERIVRHEPVERFAGWRRLVLVIGVGLAVAGPLIFSAATSTAQTPTRAATPVLSFEAASVKRSTSLEGRRGAGFQPGGRFLARNMPVRNLIAIAFGDPRPLPNKRVLGGPDWIDTDGYDIEAKAASAFPEAQTGPGFSTSGELMLQTLLTERFKLSAGREARQLPAYALVMARSDGRLDRRVRSSSGTDCVGNAATSSPGNGATPRCGLVFVPSTTGGRHLQARYLTMDELAANLTAQFGVGIDRPVLNRTDLPGKFSFDLEFTPTAMINATPTPDAGVSIFTALTEQMGLKLETVTALIDVVVVEHVERPAPN